MYADDTVVYTHAKTAEPAASKLTVVKRSLIDQSSFSQNINKAKGMF